VPDLARARNAVLATLTDTCTITDDVSGYSDDTFDPVTLTLTSPPPTAIYSGPCSVRTFSGDQPNPVTVGGADLGRLRYRLTLPYDGTEGVKEGQVCTVTASIGTGLVNRTFTIRHVTQGQWEPSRRADMEDRIGAQRLA
jgi:Family of unknown function (DUF6093)